MAKIKYKDLLTKDYLIQEYIKRQLSTRQIMNYIGTNKTTILYYLKKYNILIRKTHNAQKLRNLHKSEILTKKFLINEYIVNNKKINEIVELTGCCSEVIRKRLKEFKIKKEGHLRQTKCSTCGRSIFRYDYQLNKSKDFFCSKECFKKHRSLYNPMHSKEAKLKSSLTHKKLLKRGNFKDNIYCCRDCANVITWKSAIYGNGRCKACSNKGAFNSNFGKTILIKKCKYNNQWFKSSWEANFAKWCDGSGIEWKYELKAFEVKINKKITHYTPDFYLPEFDMWIEVKGRWMKDAQEKFTCFLKQYPNINIHIFDKDKLEEFSIYKYWELKK